MLPSPRNFTLGKWNSVVCTICQHPWEPSTTWTFQRKKGKFHFNFQFFSQISNWPFSNFLLLTTYMYLQPTSQCPNSLVSVIQPCLFFYTFCNYYQACMVTKMVKNLPAIQESWAWFLGQEDPLEKGMTSHSSIRLWSIPWTEEPGGPHLMDCKQLDMTELLSYLDLKLFYLALCLESLLCQQSSI